MKRKIVWLGVSWLIVAALVLASCGPGVPEEEEEEATILSIGETFQSSGVAVTISEAIVTDSFEYIDKATGKMSTMEADAGESFLIVTAEIKNVGDMVLYGQGQQQITAYDSEDTIYLWDGSTTTHYTGMSWEADIHPYPGEDALPTSKALNPGGKIEGKMNFIIPEVASGLKIAFWRIGKTLREPAMMWEIE